MGLNLIGQFHQVLVDLIPNYMQLLLVIVEMLMVDVPQWPFLLDGLLQHNHQQVHHKHHQQLQQIFQMMQL